MAKLLALDQSSRITGFAIFDNHKLIHYGKIVCTEEDIGERLQHIRKELNNIIWAYNIEEVVFEDIQLQDNILNNVKTFKILAEVYGVVSELLTELKIPHVSMVSTAWKSKLNIKGSTRPIQKKNAQAYVRATYGVTASEDESDSICIGTAYLMNDAFVWE